MGLPLDWGVGYLAVLFPDYSKFVGPGPDRVSKCLLAIFELQSHTTHSNFFKK